MGSVITPLWSPMISAATLRARHHSDGRSWVLELSGEADLATSGMMRLLVAHMGTVADRHIVVDVSRLVFCDVASAHLIMTAQRTLPVTVRGASGSVKRVFDLLDAIQHERIPRFLPPLPPARDISRRTVAV